jgi:hypothetical protein
MGHAQEDHMANGDRQHDEPADEGYIGSRPERATETIPGGVQPDDERVAAHDTQSSGTGKREDRVQGRDDEWPAGHREADTPKER